MSKIPTENPAAAVDKISSHSVRHVGITARKIAFSNRKHRSSKLRLMWYLRRKIRKIAFGLSWNNISYDKIVTCALPGNFFIMLYRTSGCDVWRIFRADTQYNIACNSGLYTHVNDVFFSMSSICLLSSGQTELQANGS